MALKIRLARGGAKKRPYYRIVVTDSRMARDGRFIERIGSYNPLLPRDAENRVVLNTERAQYWLGNGAQPTDRVARFLDELGLRTRKAKNNPNKAKPKAKAQERLAMKAEAEAQAKEAAEAEAAEANEPAEAEAPAEE